MLESQDKSADLFLESSVKQFKIFIDTCSLLSDHADLFWGKITPILEREHKSIIVPFRVYEELKKFSDDPKLCVRKGKPELNQRAKVTLKNMAALQSAGLIEIFGDENDAFADNVFQTVFTRFRLKYNLMLITQDRALASDILNIGQSKSVNTKNQIQVYRITNNGNLIFANARSARVTADSRGARVTADRKNHAGYSPNQKADIPTNECFSIAHSVLNISGKMPVSSIPSKGSIITAERNGIRKQLTLVDEKASGGEGTIYTTNVPNIVAKIYKPEKLDRAKFEKLKLMMTKSIDCDGICFPLALLYNDRSEFVGYLMNKAEGRELQRCLFIPQLLSKNFPNWTKVDTTKLCITILNKLKYLHERNVILGDINPNNILVVSPDTVYFVDTDSYQIEGFPCPVGTINYTAPEIQRKEYSSFLRTIGNENFAVATLLFMIMLPGKPPYSLQGGENQIDNIINGDFAYACGERSTGKAPKGMWRFCWSHLPFYLKEAFYETFRKGGSHNTEATRYSTEDWLQMFEHYLHLLESGKLQRQDAMSLDIFPSRLKKNPKVNYICCKACGKEVSEDQSEDGLCLNCFKQAVYTTIRCSQCGQTFEITNGEKAFFDKKGFQLPKKCKECRGQRTYANNPYFSSGSSGSSSSASNAANGATYMNWLRPSINSGSFCFITTAACEHLGKPDDCYELTLLRQFRDGWLASQSGGYELIQEYYRVAPLIVEALNASYDSESLYKDIWDRYIIPCVRFIEQNSYEACTELYKEMVQNLTETYLMGN